MDRGVVIQLILVCSQGYERKQQYILAQGPLRNTVDDFWRMIWEHRVYTVVMLCCLEENNIVSFMAASLSPLS